MHTNWPKRFVAVTVSVAMLALGLVLIESSSPAFAATTSFNFSGGSQTYTVPAGVTAVRVEAWGARGGGSGGYGAYAAGTLTVSPGQTLQVNVGGSGDSGGWNGGGAGGGPGHGDFFGPCCFGRSGFNGGGATDIQLNGSRVVVGGGGGGRGGDANQGAAKGGAGGDASAGSGSAGSPGSANGGGGVGVSQGGSQGASGGSGSGDSASGGGGGGGGYNGGGGGGGGVPIWGSGGGGGAGSSYTGGVNNASTTNAVKDGNGFAAITAVEINTGSLSQGAVGVSYNQTLSASSGSAPYTWDLAGSVLPAGLSLSSGGTISGTPAGASTGTYSFRVTDSQGLRTTATLSLTIGATPTVTTGSATNLTQTTATLNATVNANYTATSSITIKYSTSQGTVNSGGGTSASVSPTSASGGGSTAITANITGLTSAVTYYYRASAVNSNGTTNGLTQSFTTLGVPAAPTLGAVTPGVESLTITWTPGADHGSAITGWSVQVCSLTTAAICNSNGDAGWIDIDPQDPLTAGSTSATATGLSNPHRYWMRVAAINGEGLGAYRTTQSATLVEADVTNLENFQQGSSAPTLTLEPTAITITPLADGATAARYLDVTATDQDAVTDFNRISLCLYFDNPTAPTADGNCDNEDLNPANQVLLVWTEATNSFTVVANPDGAPSDWSIDATGAGSASDYDTNSTAIVLSLRYSFHASEVMREAPVGEWKVKATAIDDAAFTATDSDSSDVDITVNHFSAVTVARASQSYGVIAAGSSAVSEDVSAGTLVTNGTSSITYRLGNDFTTGPVSLTNANGAVGTPPAFGSFAFDCRNAPTYDDSGAQRIATAPAGAATLVDGITDEGTTEAGVNDFKQSCKVWYGGASNVPNGTAFNANVITATGS